MLTKLLDEHGVVISGGQGKMAGKMWRWGTMGVVSEADMVAALAAFEIVIRQMGYPFEDGAAVNAALDVFARTGKKELHSEAASLRAWRGRAVTNQPVTREISGRPPEISVRLYGQFESGVYRALAAI